MEQDSRVWDEVGDGSLAAEPLEWGSGYVWLLGGLGGGSSQKSKLCEPKGLSLNGLQPFDPFCPERCGRSPPRAALGLSHLREDRGLRLHISRHPLFDISPFPLLGEDGPRWARFRRGLNYL